MLPGFRFVFAATLLTISLVVFGLGAAALLRASHDRFASLPPHPVAGPPLAIVADAVTPTLSMLRIETPEPAESRAVQEPSVSADTLLPHDRVAAFIPASRVEEVVPAPQVAPEPKIELKAEAKPELPTIELTPEPPRIEAKAEPTPDPPAQVAAPKTPVAEAVSAIPAPIAVPAEPVVATKVEETAKAEMPASAPQRVAAVAEPEINTAISAQPIVELSLVNAQPIRRPPVPRDRPTDADIVAALPDLAVATPAPEAEKPAVRRRRAIVKRVVRQRRAVTRPTVVARPLTSLFGR